MSILIKGMKMPKEDELLCIKIYPNGKVAFDMDLQCKQVAEAVEVLDHGDLEAALPVDVSRQKIGEWINDGKAYALYKCSV